MIFECKKIRNNVVNGRQHDLNFQSIASAGICVMRWPLCCATYPHSKFPRSSSGASEGDADASVRGFVRTSFFIERATGQGKRTDIDLGFQLWRCVSDVEGSHKLRSLLVRDKTGSGGRRKGYRKGTFSFVGREVSAWIFFLSRLQGEI